jgi:solute carrier family 25 carnitine/acylcarnitine transporter 20/29
MINDFIFGIFGGLSGTLISHPFDTIKTRIQTGVSPNIKSAIRIGKLYSGLTPPLIGIIIEKSIVFGFYDHAKKNNFNNFWSGIISGFMSTLIITPIDKLKINLQNKKTIMDLKLYHGFIPTVFRDTPGFGIYFSTYNYLLDKYHNKTTDKLTFYDLTKIFLFGASSGLCAWIFIYPSDLIKTNIQYYNTNIFDTCKIIWNKNNNIKLLNFYKGFSYAILRALPLHGGVFLGYELSKNILSSI